MWGVLRGVGAVVAAVSLWAAVGTAVARDLGANGVTALAPRHLFDAGPAIAGDRAIYGITAGKGIRFWSAPLGGGPVTRLPDLAASGSVGGWALAASDQRLAVDAYVLNPDGNDGHSVLYSATPGAVPSVLADPIATLSSTQRQSLFVAGSQVLTLETPQGRLVTRDETGGRSEFRFPAGAQSTLAAVAGTLVAVPVKSSGSRAIVVIDRTSGDVVRRVPIDPRFGDPAMLVVSPDGALISSGDNGLQWSPAGSTRFASVAGTPETLTPVIRANRVAYAETTGDPALVRPTVVELPATLPRSGRQIVPRVLFQGPPTGAVRTLDFDGTHLAWSTTSCQLLTAVPAPSTRSIPPGPCVRSDATFLGFSQQRPTVKRPWLRLGITCATAADGFCHVTIHAYQGPPLATGRFDVPVGAKSRIVHIRLSRRALRRVQQHPDTDVLVATLRDPSGRTYTDDFLP